ncbi:MAG: hypothetical protein ACYTHM_21775 [Planctomycetota bacterium]|jgi:hypothetical protein
MALKPKTVALLFSIAALLFVLAGLVWVIAGVVGKKHGLYIPLGMLNVCVGMAFLALSRREKRRGS